jgi:F1F0 ATPase subunit 2
MTVTDMLTLPPVLVAGALLGGVFYGGLWWTVSRAMMFQRPALWFLGSLLLRTGVALAGIYILFDGQWERLLACMLGFAVGRMAVTCLTRPGLTVPAHGRQSGLDKEAVHAP